MFKKLGEIASFKRGLTFNKGDEAPMSSKCVLRSNNIDLESSTLDLSDLKYLREDFIIPEERKLKANSIFVCMSNGSKQHVGKVAFIDHDMDYAFGGFMGLIVPSTEVVAKYVYYACLSPSYRSFLSKVGNGIGITNLRFSDLDEFLISVPDYSTQQCIVDELDLLTGIIKKKNEQLKVLDKLSESIFYEMFGDPISNEKEWPVVLLDSISSCKIGINYKPENVCDDGTIVLRSSNIQDSQINLNDLVRVNCPIKEQQYVQKGDILMCSRNGSFKLVGKVAKINELPEKMTYGAFMTIIRSNYNPYLFQFFKLPAFRTQLGLAKTATINQITIKMLAGTKVPLPPERMLDIFADKMDAINKIKESICESIKESEQLLASRMDKYFSE